MKGKETEMEKGIGAGKERTRSGGPGREGGLLREIIEHLRWPESLSSLPQGGTPFLHFLYNYIKATEGGEASQKGSAEVLLSNP